VQFDESAAVGAMGIGRLALGLIWQGRSDGFCSLTWSGSKVWEFLIFRAAIINSSANDQQTVTYFCKFGNLVDSDFDFYAVKGDSSTFYFRDVPAMLLGSKVQSKNLIEMTSESRK
jgi:hypothetical protein